MAPGSEMRVQLAASADHQTAAVTGGSVGAGPVVTSQSGVPSAPPRAYPPEKAVPSSIFEFLKPGASSATGCQTRPSAEVHTPPPLLVTGTQPGGPPRNPGMAIA